MIRIPERDPLNSNDTTGVQKVQTERTIPTAINEE